MNRLDQWMVALEARHLADLRFAEVTRALRALSSTYVERRSGLRGGAALSGGGKRAAFALFYGPLHYLLTQAIVTQLPGANRISGPLVDLGCGTGAAGAAWASACERPPALVGVDRHPWAVREATIAYRDLAVEGRAVVGDIGRDPLPRGRAYLAAFALNELPDQARERLLAGLLDRANRGDAVLIVEPLAKTVAPWWGRAIIPFVEQGGRVDEWRFHAPLPPLVEKLDRAAGLRHREITGRSLWIAGASTPPRGRAASS
ncbi:MAG: methyltransferase domain-containing protein [Vicinamibacterales bacterium]